MISSCFTYFHILLKAFILNTAAKWLKDVLDANFDIYQKKKQTNKQKNPKEASKQILIGFIQTRNTAMGLQSLRTVQKKNHFLCC